MKAFPYIASILINEGLFSARKYRNWCTLEFGPEFIDWYSGINSKYEIYDFFFKHKEHATQFKINVILYIEMVINGYYIPSNS